MTSVGEMLRREREVQGRGVAEIAEDLCITQRYLRAIEEDDLKSLPGTFFYKSFVRQYAAILGLSAEKIQAEVESLTSSDHPLPLPGHDPRYSAAAQDPIVSAANRRLFSERRVALPVAALVLMLVACSGFYAWWNRAPQTSAKARATPSGVTAPSSVPAAPVAEVAAKPSSSPGVEVSTITGPDGVNQVVVNVSATEKTWISITSDGKQIFSGTLEPSQTKTLTGHEVARMKVGNAGGLEVRWNGKPIGPIGPRGKVRVVLFTPENFQIIEPTPPASGS